jgi:hypothetical protein
MSEKPLRVVPFSKMGCDVKIVGQSPGAVAELADALDLGSSSFGSAGSIPVSPIFFSADSVLAAQNRFDSPAS